MHSLHCLIVFLSQKTKTVAAVALSALCALEVFGIWTLFSKVYSLLHYIESAMIFRNTFFPLRPWIIADAGTSFIASAKFLLNKNREARRAGQGCGKWEGRNHWLNRDYELWHFGIPWTFDAADRMPSFFFDFVMILFISMRVTF